MQYARFSLGGEPMEAPMTEPRGWTGSPLRQEKKHAETGSVRE